MGDVEEQIAQPLLVIRVEIQSAPEAMPVDAVLHARPVNQPSYSQLEKEVYFLKTQYGKLETKIDRLLNSPLVKTPTSLNSRPATSSWQGQETRVCYACGRQGHLWRQCRSKPRTPAGQGPSDRQRRTKPPQSSPVVGLEPRSQ